jgi:hypothetical protein
MGHLKFDTDADNVVSGTYSRAGAQRQPGGDEDRVRRRGGGGRARARTERDVHVANARDFVHVPRGEIHGTENVSDTEEAHLVFCSPGVPDKEAAETVFVE